jgi:hypothetical protein
MCYVIIGNNCIGYGENMNENITNNIVCSKCGTQNEGNLNFCNKCGASLKPEVSTSASNGGIQVANSTAQQPIPQQNDGVTSNGVQQSSGGSLNYVSYVIGAFLKPYEKYKSEENKLSDIKNASILSLILIGVLTVVGLITTMISVVRVTSFLSSDVEWAWGNLKNVPYLKVIGQSILIYAGLFAAIAGVYFLASLVIKKEAKFPKLLGAVATAFIPYVGASVVSPIISMIYSPLGLVVSVVGFIYSLTILLELVNSSIVIDDKDTKIHFHMICLSILIVGLGLIVYKLVLGSMASGLLGSLF